MACLADCFFLTMSWTHSAPPTKVLRWLFRSHFFPAVGQTWPNPNLAGCKAHTDPLLLSFFRSTLVCDEVSPWVAEELLLQWLLWFLKWNMTLCTQNWMPRAANGRWRHLSVSLVCSWPDWKGRKVMATLWWLWLAGAVSEMEGEQKSLWLP